MEKSLNDKNLTRRGFLKLSALGTAALWVSPEDVVALHKRGRRAVSHPLPAASVETVVFNRLGFGPRPGDLQEFHRLGPTSRIRLEKYSEFQLHPSSIDDSACESKLAALNLSTLKKPLRQLWNDHFVVPAAMRAEQDKLPQPSPLPSLAPKAAPKPDPSRDLTLEPVRQTEIATWMRIIYSRRQLQEVLADFWHNHFNVFGWDTQISPVFVHYDRDVIRTHMMGNFRELLEAVATSPAMLFYLDNFVNQSGNPNENYARELFELHTLGAENYLGTRDRNLAPGYASGQPIGYVDGDVYEASRCFTGWRVESGSSTANTGEFAYFEPWHDRFQKIVLGRSLKEYQPPMKDGRDVLDLLAAHPGTARFLARKICRRLVCDDPPASLVAQVASVFHEERKSPDQLRRVVRTVILSPEFASSWGTKLKRPIEAAASMIRATEAEFVPSEGFFNQQGRAGQRLFQWHSPDGYPDTHGRWTSTTSFVERWRFCNLLVNNQIPGVKADLAGKTPSGLRNAASVVQFLSDRLLGYSMEPRSLLRITSFLGDDWPDSPVAVPGYLRSRVPATAALILMSPEFQRK